MYRLPLVDHPRPTDLEVFHTFTATRRQPLPGATGLAFGQSGRLYVALGGANQIAVLAPDGTEVRRFSSPLFDSPTALAFMGYSLLATNGDFSQTQHPGDWNVVKTDVGEPGLPPVVPEL